MPRRQLTSFDVATETPEELRDRLGWSETPEEDMTAVVMRLCDIVAGLQAEVARPKGHG